MKNAPNIFFVVLLWLMVLSSCGQEANRSHKPTKEQNLERPNMKSRDSSLRVIPTSPATPDTISPKRAKKKSKSDLDTLRPIKA